MEQLGIDPVQLLLQIFNFIVMVVVLTKFLYKPILKALDERKRKIAQGLEYAEKMKAELEKNELKRQQIIAKAEAEVKKIIEEGKKEGKNEQAEIIAKANLEAQNILGKARTEIDLERADMEKKLKQKTVEIAQNIVDKILRESLTEKDHQKIITTKLDKIAKVFKA